jgi:putative endonuclease
MYQARRRDERPEPAKQGPVRAPVPIPVPARTPAAARAPLPTSFARSPDRDQGRSARIGRRGELAAAVYLERRGYRVLARNWRSIDPAQRGELDLILRRRRVLVVCEVKTRTGGWLAHPAEAVTAEKLARLRRLALIWLREHTRSARRPGPGAGLLPTRRAGPFIPESLRIDVVAVRLGPREPFPVLAVEHLRGVS